MSEIYSRIKKKMLWVCCATASTVSSFAVAANTKVSLGSGSNNSQVFNKIQAAFQHIVDFVGTTGSLFIIFLSAVSAIGLWIAAPKASGLMGWIFRIMIGAIALFNIGLIISWWNA